jgi:hypothetical protein
MKRAPHSALRASPLSRGEGSRERSTAELRISNFEFRMKRPAALLNSSFEIRNSKFSRSRSFSPLAGRCREAADEGPR